MDIKQQIERELHETRAALAAALQSADTDGSALDELTAKIGELEKRAAAVQHIADPVETEKRAEDGEAAEWRKLLGGASLSAIFGAAAEGRALPADDPVSEIRQELGLPDGAIPWEMLAPDAPEAPEARADVATAPEATALAASQQPILARAFAASDLGRLGVTPIQAGSGDQTFPRIDTGHTPGAAAAGAPHDATAATITGVTATPRRAVARYVFRVEDAARLRGLEAALRADARQALGEAVDGQVLAGSGAAPNVTGLFDDGAGLATDADPGTASTFANVVSALAGKVDGRYARQLSELRSLVSASSYAYLAGLFRSAESDMTALDWLRSRTANATVSVHAPAADGSNVSRVLVHKASTPGRNAALAMWGTPVVLRDPYSRAAEGEVALTITTLFDFKIVRAAAWAIVKIQSA